MKRMKRQKDRILKDELNRLAGAQYAPGEQWTNNSRKNEEMEQSKKKTQKNNKKKHPVVVVTGGVSKV